MLASQAAQGHLMHAIYYRRQGPAEEVLEFGQLPEPEPGPGEVRVKLHCSGANPSDWKSRGGRGAAMFSSLIIPHSDGAGVIEALGAGSTHRLGERVWIWNGQYRRAYGTAAESIVVPDRQAVRLPSTSSFEMGACLGIPALTALRAVRLAHIGKGMTVLVTGGAGAVGHYAIQLAKQRQAYVIATVSSAAKAIHALDAGADEVIDYRADDVAARIAAICGRVDVLLDVDFASHAGSYTDLVKPHGTVVVYGSSQPTASLPILALIRASITIRPFLVYDIPGDERTGELAELNSLLETGSLDHAIGIVLPLAQTARAHALGEEGAVVGNILLSILK